MRSSANPWLRISMSSSAWCTIEPSRFVAYHGPDAALSNSSYLTMTALLGGGLAGALVLIPLLYVGVPVRYNHSSNCSVRCFFDADKSLTLSRSLSGAHLNPAVTLVSYLIFPERLSFLNSFYYILCQLVGAFTGASLGWLILDSTYAPVIDHFGRAFVTEVGFTSLLLVTALAAFSGHV